MTLRETMEMWELTHDSNLFVDIPLHPKLDRDALIDYLVSEYGDMLTVENYSETMHRKIINFFKTHEWNINKLTETLYFDYNPIWNSEHYTDTTWSRDEQIDSDFNEEIDYEEDGNEHEQGHTDETDVHLVSGYNDVESRLNGLIDTEHDRDVITVDYTKDSNYHKDGDRDTENHRTNVEDEDYHGLVKKWAHEPNRSYQELIEEERKQAQFNIYKWIGKHFSEELLICVW